MADSVGSVIARCLKGEQAAFGELIARYRGQVYGLCLRMLGQHQDAEDVSQETFLRAVRSLENWDSQRDFEPWLLAIAGNRCRTALAARKKRPAAVGDVVDCVDARASESSNGMAVEEVRVALEGLREEYRQAFLLYHLEQRGYEEVSRLMKCPVGTVKTWVYRARLELMEALRRRDVMQERQHVVR